MTPTPDQTPERPKTESLALIICDREGYPVGGHEERQPQGEYVRADECLKMEQEYERKLTTLRATNATLLQRIAKLEEDRADLSKCVQWLIDNTSEEARRLFPGTIARLQKIASAVLPPTPGATNATLERVRRLEEAEWAKHWRRFVELGEMLEETKDDSAQERQPALTERAWLIDQLNAMAESILTDSASPVLPIKQAFCALHQAWLVAHHRSCMNETMDALAVVLGLDPMNPSKGLPTPGAAVGKEGE